MKRHLAFACVALATTFAASSLRASDLPEPGNAIVIAFEYAVPEAAGTRGDAPAFRKHWARAMRVCDEHKGFVTGYAELPANETSSAPYASASITCHLQDDTFAATDPSERKHTTMAFIYDTEDGVSAVGRVHAVGDRESAYEAARDKVRDNCMAQGQRVGSMRLSHRKNALGGETVEGHFACTID